MANPGKHRENQVTLFFRQTAAGFGIKLRENSRQLVFQLVPKVCWFFFVLPKCGYPLHQISPYFRSQNPSFASPRRRNLPLIEGAT